MDSSTLQHHLDTIKNKSMPPITPTTLVSPIVPLTLPPSTLEGSTILSKNPSSLYFSPQSPTRHEEHLDFGAKDDLVSSSTSLLNQSIRRMAVPLERERVDEEWNCMLYAADTSTKHNNITLVDFDGDKDAQVTIVNDADLANNTFNFVNNANANNNLVVAATTTSHKVPLGFKNPSYSGHQKHMLVPQPQTLQPPLQTTLQPLQLQNHQFFQQQQQSPQASYKLMGSYDNLKGQHYRQVDTSTYSKNNGKYYSNNNNKTLNKNYLKASHRSSSSDSLAHWYDILALFVCKPFTRAMQEVSRCS